jgi:uncharacterized membrane protein (UPF0127 family)
VSRYVVFNCTRQTLVASRLEVTDTVWSRMKGLIGRSGADFQPGMGLWIVPAEGVHTIGMSFPIDVAYLDGRQRVIHICHRLPPMRIGAMKWKARSVLELPAGTLAESLTEVGDLLQVLDTGKVQGVQ